MTDGVKAVLRKAWKEAAVLAVAAALLLEIGINVVSRRTVWHRLEALEEKVKGLEHTRELEELRTRQQLDDLRQRANSNTEEIVKVEEKVEKKK
jgi:C4-dicarboxylate-specific signal transduction histidine kinase